MLTVFQPRTDFLKTTARDSQLDFSGFKEIQFLLNDDHTSFSGMEHRLLGHLERIRRAGNFKLHLGDHFRVQAPVLIGNFNLNPQSSSSRVELGVERHDGASPPPLGKGVQADAHLFPDSQVPHFMLKDFNLRPNSGGVGDPVEVRPRGDPHALECFAGLIDHHARDR